MNSYSLRARENRKIAYHEKTTAQFKEWALKMELVKAKIAMGSINVRIDINNKIESWYEHEKDMKIRLEDLGKATVDTYDSLRIKALQTWTEISNFMKTLEDKKDETLKIA